MEENKLRILTPLRLEERGEREGAAPSFSEATPRAPSVTPGDLAGAGRQSHKFLASYQNLPWIFLIPFISRHP